MELINRYKELKNQLKENPNDIEIKKDIDNIKKDFFNELKIIFRVDKLDEFSIEGFINTFGEDLFDTIERLGGLEVLKTKDKPKPEEITQPENLNNFNKLVEQLVEKIDLSSSKEINIAFSSDFDGDGVFGQIAIKEFQLVLKQLGIKLNIINIEARNDKGRGVNKSELEHEKIKHLEKVDMFITTDSNFDKENLKGYKLPNNLKDTQFVVTDHHHTNGKAPSFIDPKNFFEVNPHLTTNQNQNTFSGAALISMVLKATLNKKGEEGLFFNTNIVKEDFEKTFNNIIYTTNMGDVATNNTLLEPDDSAYELSMEYYNLFNTLNIYKRLKIIDFESLKKQLPENMSDEEINELFEELKSQYKKIKIIAEEPRINETRLLFKTRSETLDNFELSHIQDFLLLTTDSYTKEKVGGRHDLMKRVLKDFKKSHQKIQRKIKEKVNTEKTTIKTNPEASNTTFTEYSKTRGYKLISTVFPSTTETAIGFVRNYDEEGKLDRISIVGGRSQLKEKGKQGWEIFKDETIKTLWDKLKEKLGEDKLSTKTKEEIKNMIVFLGHGGAFGGYINIPQVVKDLNIPEDELVNMIKDSFHLSISKNKKRIKKQENKNKILVTKENLIDLPAIIKMYDRLQGYKHSSKLPNVVLELPESYEYENEKVYQAMGLFSGEAFILNGELKAGDFVEFNMSKGAMMMSNLISKEEAQQIPKYNNGQMIDSPHVEDLMNEINNAEELEKGIYFSEEKGEPSNEPKISIDLETTGSNAETSDVYNIGIVSNDGNGNIRKYSIFTNTYMPLSSIVLTRISQEFLDEYANPDMNFIDKKIIEILNTERELIQDENGKATISAHNGMNFDFRMLERKLPGSYEELMLSNKYDLRDTTYLARKAMGDETGLKISNTKIRFQNYQNIKELDINTWLRDQLNGGSNSSKKLYNIYEEGEYFTIDKGTDKQNRLVYMKNNDKTILIEDLNQTTVEEFLNSLKEEKIPAKFSIDLITKLVATHDIMYKLNEDILKTEHKINENIFESLGDKPQLKNAIKAHLEDYYFTLSKNKNVSLLMNKLKNLKIDESELSKIYDMDINDFVNKLDSKNDFTIMINKILNKDGEIETINDLFDSKEFKKEGNKNFQLEELENYIFDNAMIISGRGIDQKVIIEEYINDFDIGIDDWEKPKEGTITKQIKAWLTTKGGKDIIENKILSSKTRSIKLGEIVKEIEEAKLKTTSYYEKGKLISLVEEQIEKEVLEVQKAFLKDNPGKATITEEISTMLYLVQQDYLINLTYDNTTEEELKKYSENLSSKTGVSKGLILKVVNFIKTIYDNKENNEYQDIYTKIEHYFKKEHHMAMEDAKAEQEVMRVFLEKFYPIEGAKQKEKIQSASAELVKRTFTKKVRDNYNEKGFVRVPTKYHEADQDIFVKRQDKKEMEKEDFENIEKYLELTELINVIAATKNAKEDYFSKTIRQFKEKYQNVEITPNFDEYILEGLKKPKEELENYIPTIIEELNKELKSQNLKDSVIEDFQLFYGSIIQLKHNIEDLDEPKIMVELEKIKSRYEIKVLNQEFKVKQKMRNVIDKKPGKCILDLDKASEFEKNPLKQKMKYSEPSQKDYIDENIEVFMQSLINLLKEKSGFKTDSMNKIVKEETYIIEGIYEYLQGVLEVMDMSETLSIDNLKIITNQLATEFSKSLGDNEKYNKSNSKPSMKKVKELLFKYIDFVKSIEEKEVKEKSQTIHP